MPVLNRALLSVLLGVCALSAPVLAAAPGAAAPFGPDIHYGGPAFAQMVKVSYAKVGKDVPLDESFTHWAERSYAEDGVLLGDGKTLTAALSARRAAIQAATGDDRVALERDTAQWAHTFIKKAVPKFNLERGHELAYMVRNGERQCLAQSVVIAALLQQAGVPAGVVMVWENQHGQESNLGHAVTVARLANGRDLLVDASDPTPFIHHQGLLIRVGDTYRFVNPQYGADDSISAYAQADGSGTVSVARMAPLSLNYINSQFYVYRGEREPGQFLAPLPNDPAALKRGVGMLQQAMKIEPQNAQARYDLAWTERKLGQNDLAAKQFVRSATMYQAQGHVPSGVKESLAWVKSRSAAAAAP